MTDQEINIAVATACGWKQVEVYEWTKDNPPTRIPKQYHIESDGDVVGLPDYANDLNAMHEAEMIMEPKNFSDPNYLEKYESILEMLCNKQFGFELRATARQRAEALIRALGKWKP